MTEEILMKAVSLGRDVKDCEYYAKLLETIQIGVIPSSWRGGFIQSINEIVSLIPEEEEALEALRKAYKEILIQANERKLKECKRQFEAL